jgi:hypothetical protein
MPGIYQHVPARRRIAVALVMAIGAALVAAVPAPPALAATVPGSDDALQARVRSELAVFTGWLAANNVKGYVGEVGWPNNADTASWNALATKWYADAAAAGMWTTAWATGEWWGCGYKLSVYTWSTCSTMDGTLNTARSQAAVLEAQTDPDNRGINVAGGEFGTPGPLDATSPFSNANPGVYDTAYHYDLAASFTYLASRGVTTVRLPLRWERLQRTLGGPLDAAEVQRITSAVGRASTAGLKVILDVHNYGAYWLSDGTQGVRRAIGSSSVTVEHFATLWRHLSTSFKGNAGVLGYGLMNEPVNMPGGALAWEQASQAAVDAVRANGDTKLVLVPGYNWSGAQQWTTQHPDAWVVDSASNVRYEAHHYWDRDNSGNYPNSYAAEVTNATSRGYTASPAAGNGTYRALTPARILDTRTGTGGISTPIGPGGTVDMQVTGRGSVPTAGVSAVAMNVTVVEPTASGHLTVFPAGAARPLAANLNFSPGQIVPNLVVAKLGAGGKVSVFNSAGSTNIVVDVAGWFSDSGTGAAGRYTAVTPARILDTRLETVRLGPGTTLDLQVSGRGGLPSSGVGAAVVNVAVTNTTASSFLTVYPTGGARPEASNLNFGAGNTVSNRAMVTLGAGGKVTLFNSAGTADVIVDVGGWYSDATVSSTSGLYTPVVPARILDTRGGMGALIGLIAGTLGTDVQVTGLGGVPSSGVTAVVLNATVTQPLGAGHLTVSPAGSPRPLASDLNFAGDETRPNLVVVRVGTGGKVNVYASTPTHVVFDVAGWFS